MGFRCELCDEWLPMLQFSKLCPTCYKIRTIVKCYSAKEILTHLEKNFLVSNDKYVEQQQRDKKFFEEEERRLEKEFNAELARLNQEKEEVFSKEEKLEPVKEEAVELKERHKGVKGLDGDVEDDNKVANDQKDYDAPVPKGPYTRKQKKVNTYK